jgi:hypothetical protein
MKYFKVKSAEKVVSPQGNFMHKRTEIYLAKDSVAVYEDLSHRFGERLIFIDAVEVDEKKVKPNTNVLVVI